MISIFKYVLFVGFIINVKIIRERSFKAQIGQEKKPGQERPITIVNRSKLAQNAEEYIFDYPV